jgi:N-acetylmuramoyl-L-alanine amidase
MRASTVARITVAAALLCGAAEAASGRPDRTLYESAKQARAKLDASRTLQSRRSEWEKTVLRYRTVVARYPQSPYCDNALLAAGDLYRSMAKRFKSSRYAEDAVAAYRMLVAEYPSSSLGETALHTVVEIAREAGDDKRLAEAVRAYLAAFPDSTRASAVKAHLKKKSPVQAAALPTPPPPGLVQLFNLRFWSGDSSTRVVIDLEKPVQIRYDRISGPDRLWVDLVGARLHPNLTHRSFPVGDGLLEQIRLGQNRDNVVRVVLDFKDVEDHSVFFLEDPTRLVVDVKGTPRPAVADGTGTTPLPAASPAAATSDASSSDSARPSPTSSPVAPANPAVPADRATPLPARRLADLTPPSPPAGRPSPPPIEIDAPAGKRVPVAAAAGPTPTPPAPPQANRAGSYSLARQLGLGARRIVIDPGHGGHDPGTIGRAGLQEKDLVLDVARRLESMVRSELAAEVVMTRDSDVFIPLEERTAIANSKGADLFLSIHANASRSARARGIETYFLNFAKDPDAEEVAARENSISAATLKDLQGLVKAITTNSKIDESRDFAATVQEAMVTNLKPHNAGALNRGVHTAPFYVLIGANMPSVLAEIAFVSHPDEEKLLKTPEYRQHIAQSLLKGVRAYLLELNQTQTRQLTGAARRPTVTAKDGRR